MNPIESTPGAYPDIGPMPHRYVTAPSSSANSRVALAMKVPAQIGVPTHVRVEASLQDVRRFVRFKNDSGRTRRIGLNAARLENGQLLRGAVTDLAVLSPTSSKVIGRAHLALRMFEVLVPPGESIGEGWPATVDPGYLPIEEAAKLVTTTETEITDEVSDWIYRGDPDQPVDVYAATLRLPVDFTRNACDIDLDTGQEVFLRGSWTSYSSCIVTMLRKDP